MTIKMNTLKFTKSPNGYTPRMATAGAAGYDLYTPVDFIIKPGRQIIIDTEVSIQLPEGTYAQIASRSGNAVKYEVVVLAGVIDNDYRGSIKVLLRNLGKKNRQFQRGDRIAQLIINNYYKFSWEQVDELCDTDRGEQGFGSTGQ
ncbi:dUTPase [Spodoptera frugiperda multiple nucleopolyhedrovirus]|uniref:dUTP diphosphatase n=2 Tax=Spodoptera frugiperda nuclear polyhedrosis virus TaxID=10455 RepID=A1YJ44_NPVSF|nr:dUTPase [Spodoptera frugiperda multiple nucleopolyhedrovirus]ABM45764.1 dUTPase [Spodoptera frugiperda multiple nucleopolyhedrovirus]ADV91286.1 dUTPase [Spodoptera frugiperda multiple nucleopolyhedrovirus]AFH59005.1 dUTPase [Spodoptera frugiperda multiple nucleopolyhedrovirus]AIW01465.1 dUTPase protein [Spodoptera frugiperda multiple nucleopolyhedrovirus]QED39967.1 dUTPase [Spodoptera frugiperda multiple nucleopolyhedrovirus]